MSRRVDKWYLKCPRGCSIGLLKTQYYNIMKERRGHLLPPVRTVNVPISTEPIPSLCYHLRAQHRHSNIIIIANDGPSGTDRRYEIMHKTMTIQ